MTAKIITQKKLKEAVQYNPYTGIFTWLKRPLHHFADLRSCNTFNATFAGTTAGTLDQSTGYINVCISTVTYKAHRLAYLYTEGKMPENVIDHINGIRDDNKRLNIRSVTIGENTKNMCLMKNNKTGVMGVCFKRGKYHATIGSRKNYKHIGVFGNIFDAACARKSLEAEYGYHVNHGRIL